MSVCSLRTAVCLTLQAIIAIGGIQRLLTSGQANTAIEGAELIASMQELARGRIIIMPGGGVTEKNVAKLVRLTGVREVHFSLRKTQASAMQYRASGVYMGGALRPDEFSVSVVDPAGVHAAAQALVARL